MKLRNLIDRENIIGRYNDGRRDLLKGLNKGLKLTEEESKEIDRYWKPYLNTVLAKVTFDKRWYSIYKKTNVFNFDLKKYIPDSYFYCVLDTFFNKSEAALCLDDKNLYDLFFSDVRQPRTICRKQNGIYLNEDYRIISEEDAIKLCLQNGRVIIKPSVDSCAGSGITKWESKSSVDSLLNDAIRNTDSFVAQDIIEQSQFMDDFCNSCVNTLRLVTLLFNNSVHVVTAVMIVGGKDALTNHLHRGGICCGISPDGSLFPTAFDGQLNQYEIHPNGIQFAGSVIPNYDKCIQLVKSLAPRLSNVSKLIAWDVALDKDNNPVLIETNLRWGGMVQIAAGPIFGEMTKEILDYVRTHR